MNIQTQTGDVVLVPFADLHLSDLNPRRIVPEAGIVALAENICEVGLINPLSGNADADGIAIVAGGRRLRALARLQDDPRFQMVPVHLAPDLKTARLWASSENHLREAPHPADEIRDYQELAERGLPVPAIALAFGVSETQVARRLKLANLPEAVLGALRADRITLAQAAAFTISDDPARSEAVLGQIEGAGYGAAQIKRLLKPDSMTAGDRRVRFVGLDTYHEAGGRSSRDLFADEVYLDDVALLDQLFEDRLAAEAKTLTETGWSWAEPMTSSHIGYWELQERKLDRVYPEPGELTEDQSARYDELAEMAEAEVLDEAGETELAELQAILDGTYTDLQKTVCGAFVHVDPDGDRVVTGGLIRREDRKAAMKAGVLQPGPDAEADGARPVYSAALRRDLEAVHRGARQSALLDQPDLLLDLLAFQLSGKGGYSRPFALRTDPVETMPSTETGYVPDGRLDGALGRPDDLSVDAAPAFKRFRRQSKAKRREALTRALAALLDPMGLELTETIDELGKVDHRACWTPTAENLFGRVPASHLDTLWEALTGLPAQHPSVTTFQKLRKREKAERLEDLFASPETLERHALSAERRDALARWMPDLDA